MPISISIAQIIDGLPADLPDRWDSPATWLIAFAALAFFAREWWKATAKRRDADGRLIDNQQETIERIDRQCREKDEQIRKLAGEIDRLIVAHREVVHESHNVRQHYDLVLTEINEFAPEEFREKVEALLAEVRRRATERRAARGEIPSP